MQKVYEITVFILLGIIAGIVATIKWIAPPGDDLVFGKIKIKGRGNKQNTTIEIEDSLTAREKRRKKRDLCKE